MKKNIISIFLFILCLFMGCRKVFDANFPSSSMTPTIPSGSTIRIDSQAYELAKPQRFDLAAFRAPEPLKGIFVFTVIGLPGEEVEVKAEGIFINGEKIHHPSGISFEGSTKLISRKEIPAKKYFLIGDNFALANDSRYLGFIPEEVILGKVTHIQGWEIK
ncbi:MAG: signal peptidase I [Lentisphaeraceae bacterium]|nr:signal peptidase I [Lentisphaeraceae bacterium]